MSTDATHVDLEEIDRRATDWLRAGLGTRELHSGHDVLRGFWVRLTDSRARISVVGRSRDSQSDATARAFVELEAAERPS